MTRNQRSSPDRGAPRARNVQPRHHRAYRRPAKVADAVVCDDCALVYHAGRWHHGAPPVGPVEGGLCPACRRIRGKSPAGTVLVPASLLADRAAVERLVRTVEVQERAEHPLERLMAVTERRGDLVITTTGVHLARRVAARLERRFHRKAQFHYGDEEELRVDWSAPATPARR